MQKFNLKKILLFTSIALVCILVVFLFFYKVFGIDIFHMDYKFVKDTLHEFELSVAEIKNPSIVVAVIIILFAAKTFVPVLPISAVCIITGMVFNVPISLLIDCVGLLIEFTIRYYYGKKRGGGYVHKILQKYDVVREAIELDGNGNSMLLFVFRLVPGFPLNTISQLYGAMEFGYARYIVTSIIGMLPKIYVYTLIGRAVYDPLSPKFIAPIIALIVLSSVVAVIYDYVISKKKQKINMFKSIGESIKKKNSEDTKENIKKN